MDVQSEKFFGKLRLRAFQQYHQILCMPKNVEDFEDYFHLQHLQHALTYIGWLESPKSQLSKTFFGLKIHLILRKI